MSELVLGHDAMVGGRCICPEWPKSEFLCPSQLIRLTGSFNKRAEAGNTVPDWKPSSDQQKVPNLSLLQGGERH